MLARVLLLALALVVAAAAPAAADACKVGDSQCWCKSAPINGVWQPNKDPLLPACRVYYKHNGLERYVHIYLPPTYDGKKTFPVWIHLHGVFWATMGGVGKAAGRPVNGTDVIPKWDLSVEKLGANAIIVYPQSGGDPGTGNPAEGQGVKFRQFFQIPFWKCSVGICRDPKLDDAGFIEDVVKDLPARLPMTKGQYYLSGESAGGMLVHVLLCQSPAVAGAITAAADLLGGIGADYAKGPDCSKPSYTMPFIKMHGLDDPNIPYTQPAGKEVLFDGVRMLGAADTVAVRARDNGCGPGDAGPQVPEAGGKMLCTDLCAKKKGAPPAKVCGMVGVKHDTDHPYPGFVYEQAWAFFDKQGKAGAAAAKTKSPPVAALAAAPPAPPLPEAGAGALSPGLLVTGSGSGAGSLATAEQIRAGQGKSAAAAAAPALGAALLSALALALAL
ncbi:hypothetical protein Rsub_10455 [Raphidocelis subcapitata]|uniref:Feruloyl esterase n=1 Tax=Raphidocelis subcapitata TaxID=307507 RepID=A0A2V0PEZ1_9CHLO|nr:hypothetical protein Rsub_10455 [Raphidocelis subcapitata]|eukprot:GBF97532.1 hypothetical protein Rsub_10455 [Raphidocelis subcapitata]